MGIIKNRQTYANGKIILCNFKRLNEKDFVRGNDGDKFINDTFAATLDGKIFVNSRNENSQFLAELYATLAESNTETLLDLQKQVRAKYPFVSHANIEETTQDKQEQILILSMLAIPSELKRRELEKAYYNI